MASFVFKDAVLFINGIDLSDRVRSVTLNYSGDMQEETSMGDTTRSRLTGLLDWSLEITFKQDFDSGQVDATLFSLVGADPFPIRLRATSAGIGDTNPEFQGNGVLETYPPLAGAVGELAEVSATIQASGTLVRAVA